MTISLTKRLVKGSSLTWVEGDANSTAIETFINGILAGTTGYQAGDALKLGGVLASLFWNNDNCAKSLGTSGWQKLASGLIIQWSPITIAGSSNGALTLPVTFGTTSLAVISSVADGSALSKSPSNLVSGGTTTITLYNPNATSTSFWVLVLGY